MSHGHRIGKEQKAHSFDLFDAAATRRNARAPTAAMLLARSSQPDQWEIVLAGSVFSAKKSIFFLILPFIVSFVVRISKLKVRRVLF